MTSFFAFIFVLGVLIFVHELGHFLMARRIGVRVLTFSLGFGPKLLNVRRGDTEYCVSAIPLGGYVKMAGENPEEARTGASDEFLSKGKWQRFQVLVMGPVMNVVLALVVMWGVLYQGAQVPAYEQEPVVIGGFSDNSPAAKAGLTAGDRITSVDGKTINTWDQFELDISTKPRRTVTLGYVDNGQPKTTSLTVDSQWSMIGSGKFEMGSIGVLPQVHPQVIALSPNDPAAQAGMKPDDVILAVDGQQNVTNAQVLDLIKAHAGQTLRFTVRRGNRILDVPVVPKSDGSGVIIGAQISNYEVRTIEPGFLHAAGLSVQKNWEWTTLIVQTLAGLLTRQTSVKQLMGPVAIADLSGTAAQAGWIPLFSLMAMISLNLGLLNLMPIPVLDGGHIFILFLEGLARRDFSMRVKEKMLLAGFVLLLMLMVTVIYNDLMRIEWIQKLIPWH